MNTTQAAEKLKILLDLKPALDGYAGIPQETRLLFLGLTSTPAYDVEGLIQHGARKLRAAIPSRRRSMATSKRINRLSRVIVSLYEKPYSNFFDAIVDGAERYFSIASVRLKSQLGVSLPTEVFEPALFEDFVWRTFFSKTLKPKDKDQITAARYRVLTQPRKMMHQVGLRGLRYASTPTYPIVDTRGFDFFVAQTPFPGRLTRGSRLIVRYHDAVPVLMPHTINDKAFHQASHFYSLQDNVKSGAFFSCVSEATRNDLLRIFPQAEPRAEVIPNIVSDEYFEENSSANLVLQVIKNRLCKSNGLTTNMSTLQARRPEEPLSPPFEYLLMVSTIEPRKNHMMLVEAWERLKYTSMPKLKLVVVGGIGWDHASILESFKPWAESGDIFHLVNVPPSELRVLYRHAAATVCPSLAEGFDYSGIEAMRSGGVVVASAIPVHKEVYGHASEYFNPYSSEDAARMLQHVLGGSEGAAVRARLRKAGSEIAGRYTQEVIMPKWDEFFRRARGAKT
jgi:glycosyltransferase involved in cell wall biosynthesis